MLPAIERSVDDPDMTEDLAETLSTPTVDVEYRDVVHVDRIVLREVFGEGEYELLVAFVARCEVEYRLIVVEHTPDRSLVIG